MPRGSARQRSSRPPSQTRRPQRRTFFFCGHRLVTKPSPSARAAVAKRAVTDCPRPWREAPCCARLTPQRCERGRAFQTQKGFCQPPRFAPTHRSDAFETTLRMCARPAMARREPRDPSAIAAAAGRGKRIRPPTPGARRAMGGGQAGSVGTAAGGADNRCNRLGQRGRGSRRRRPADAPSGTRIPVLRVGTSMEGCRPPACEGAPLGSVADIPTSTSLRRPCGPPAWRPAREAL